MDEIFLTQADYWRMKREVEQNGMKLRDVDRTKITNDEYISLCEIAVRENENALMYVHAKSIVPVQKYENMCKSAIGRKPSLIRYVDDACILTPGLYVDFCRKAYPIVKMSMTREQRNICKGVWRCLEKDPDTKDFPTCGYTLEKIEPGDAYYVCTRVKWHAFKQAAVEQDVGRDGFPLMKCILCRTADLDKQFYFNGE